MYARWSLMVFCLLCLPGFLLQAQDKPAEAKNRALEQRIGVLEDYLKERLNQMTQELEARERLLQEVRAQNTALGKELSALKERLDLAEREILQLKIAISGSRPPAAAPTTVDSQPTTKPADPQPATPVAVYKNALVQKWAEALQARDNALRMAAIIELNKIADEEATAVLVEALANGDHYVRMLACKALAQRQGTSAIASLWPLLQDKQQQVRATAVQTVEKLTGIASEIAAGDSAEARESKITRWQQKIQAAAGKK